MVQGSDYLATTGIPARVEAAAVDMGTGWGGTSNPDPPAYDGQQLQWDVDVGKGWAQGDALSGPQLDKSADDTSPPPPELLDDLVGWWRNLALHELVDIGVVAAADSEA